MTSRRATVVGIGVLADLRHVLTVGWATAVDECLAGYARRRGHQDRPFGPEDLALVHGRDDVEAAAAVLEARRIVLPFGAPDAVGDEWTLHGLARRKREVVARLVEGDVRLHPDADAWLARQRAGSVVVVSSSQDAHVVADALGIGPRVAAVVGPPAPEVVVLEPPHRALVRGALAHLGAAPDDVEVLASTEPLATAARHEGVTHVVRVVRRDAPDTDDVFEADLVVRDLTELADRDAARGRQA